MTGARDETPVFLGSGGETLLGIFTRPPVAPRGTAVVLLPGGDHIPSINRNRLWVRLARRLADSGFHVLRFDYHGVGESTGLVDSFELERPFTGDVESAVRFVQGQGIDAIFLVGVCFGAGTALSCVGRVDGLRGVVACAHPVNDREMLQKLGTVAYARYILGEEGVAGLARRARRVRSYGTFVARRVRARLAGPQQRQPSRGDGHASEQFLAQVERAAALRLPTVFVYGDDDGYAERFEAARDGRLGQALVDAGGAIEVVRLDGPAHGLTTLAVQSAFAELVQEWLLDRDQAPSPR